MAALPFAIPVHAQSGRGGAVPPPGMPPQHQHQPPQYRGLSPQYPPLRGGGRAGALTPPPQPSISAQRWSTTGKAPAWRPPAPEAPRTAGHPLQPSQVQPARAVPQASPPPRVPAEVPVRPSWVCTTCTQAGAGGTALRAAVGLAVGLAVLLLVSNPIGWLLLGLRLRAVSVHAKAATGVLYGCGKVGHVVKFKQMAEFEMSAWMRNHGFKGDNSNEVFSEPSTRRRVILGALPDYKRDDVARLVGDGVGAVFSINEPWERGPIANSDPVTEATWRQAGVVYGSLDVYDHAYLTEAELTATKDFIRKHFNEGRDVYVHCRAGVGRSAMAVAFFLMKDAGFTPEAAVKHIKARRLQSTILTKLPDVTKHGAVQRGLAHYAAPPPAAAGGGAAPPALSAQPAHAAHGFYFAPVNPNQRPQFGTL